MGFSLDITRFCGKTEESISARVRKIVLDLHSDIISRSPVDTGRFRAANQISLNSLPMSSVLSFSTDASGKTTMSYTPPDAKREMTGYNLGDTIFLYNNVEYALALEYGHSKQAPQGIYRISVMELVAKLGGAYA